MPRAAFRVGVARVFKRVFKRAFETAPGSDARA
jgi:hypothetical protein